MLPQRVQDAINDQINCELIASYSYLAMATYCRQIHFYGFAQWLTAQSQEEYGHGMKLYDFMIARNCTPELKQIPAPRAEYSSLVDVFETALKQEESVSARIDALYELASLEKAFAALVELQWFITEQVEEEKTFREILGKMKMLQDDPSALLDMDRDMGTRTGADDEGEGGG